MFKFFKSNFLYDKLVCIVRFITLSAATSLLFYVIFDYEALSNFLLISIVMLVLIYLSTFDFKFINNPLSLVFLCHALIFIVIPLWYMAINYDSYQFGVSFGFINEEINFSETNFIALFYLVLFWIFSWYGLRGVVVYDKFKLDKFSLSSLVGIGAAVFLFALFRKIEFNDAKSGAAAPDETLWSYFLYDNAYVLFFSALLLIAINNKSFKRAWVLWIYSLVFLYQLAILTVFGSKASVLVLMVEMVLFPLAISIQYKDSIIIGFSSRFLKMLIIVAPILFLVVDNFRRNELEFSIIDTLNSIADPVIFLANIKNIFQRLCWGMLDQYFIIFNRLYNGILTEDNIYIFIQYLFKSSVNLLYPGTPFPDAIAPTSEIFPMLMDGSEYDSVVSNKSELLSIYNSQPYGLYGILLILFKYFAPLFVFFYMKLITYIYNFFGNPIIKISLLTFFFNNLTCFGLDADLNNGVHTLISILAMYFFIKLTNKFS